MEVKNIEEKISINNERKHTMYKRKWQQDGGVGKRRWFSVTRGTGKVGDRRFCLFVCFLFVCLFVNYSL